MEKKRFVLYDSDSRYVERFLEYVRRRPAFPFQVLGFTGREELETQLKRRECTVLLAAEADWQVIETETQRLLRARASCFFLLRENRQQEEGTFSLYKYRSLEEILRQILTACEEQAPAKQGRLGHRTRFLAVYSPLGRCFKTTCALLIGQILAEQEAVLFLSLDVLAPSPLGETGEESRSLSDLLYFRRMSDGEKRRLHSLTEHLGRLQVLLPVMNPEDIWGASPEELAGVLEEIGGEDAYDTVVVDAGSVGNPLPLLRLCDRILVPVREDAVSAAKMTNFRSYLRQCGEETVLAACRECVVPEYGKLREGCPDYRQLRYSALGRFLEEELKSWQTS